MAGFSDGTPSASLAGLAYPMDILVDPMGNMHILDQGNGRILYWPVNATEGWIVAGTGQLGMGPNQLGSTCVFTGNDS